MEIRTVKTAILSMIHGDGKTACMEQQLEYAEITPIITYEEEAVKKEIEDKDIVILLLNEETKEEIETCKKVAKLAKELHIFTVTFVSEQISKEVQDELEYEVEMLITVRKAMKESVDDIIQAIQTFLQTVREAGLMNITLEEFKMVLNEKNKVHLHLQKGDAEKVISEFGTHEYIYKRLADAKSVIFHLSMGEEGNITCLDALTEQLHNHIYEDAELIQGLKIEEKLKGNDIVLMLLVA